MIKNRRGQKEVRTTKPRKYKREAFKILDVE